MPTVTWARVDPIRRAAVVEAAEAEFGAHGFSRGSLNVIARRAGVAKGSLFQYFADKRDLYAFIADIGSQRVRSYMEARIRELDPSRPFFEFLTDLLDTWVSYFADHPQERSLHAAASFEVDTDARISVRTVIHVWIRSSGSTSPRRSSLHWPCAGSSRSWLPHSLPSQTPAPPSRRRNSHCPSTIDLRRSN